MYAKLRNCEVDPSGHQSLLPVPAGAEAATAGRSSRPTASESEVT
jgi:hypothetical protein